MNAKRKEPKRKTDSKKTPSSKASISLTDSRSKWIRTERPFTLPTYVKDALKKLDDIGHVAYVVGGSVRDFLLNRTPKDHDIATSADPATVCDLFPNAITIGKDFGVIKVPVQDEQRFQDVLEITTFRKDLEYRDHRHPTGILFAGPEEDARRRDFTINALYYDPKTHRILDTVDGMDDLRAGIIRAIGRADERFKEDALRLLRAVRFSTLLGFKIHPETASALSHRASLIKKISMERVHDELEKMMTGPHPAQSVRMLSEFDLLKHVLPEIESLKGVAESPLIESESDIWQHTLKVLEALDRHYPERSVELSWAALFHEIGKPIAALKSKGKNFNGHEREAEVLIRKVGERLRFKRLSIHIICQIVEEQLKFREVFKMREATLIKWLRQSTFKDQLALHRVDAITSDGNLAFYEFCASRLEELEKAAPESSRLIDGKDLIQLGFRPGPQFSQILETIEDLVLEGKITTKEQALEFAIKHFVN